MRGVGPVDLLVGLPWSRLTNVGILLTESRVERTINTKWSEQLGKQGTISFIRADFSSLIRWN